MAKEESSDLIMMFVLDRRPIPAESRTNLLVKGPSADPMLTGFEKGRMFEITKFSFGADAAGKDDDADKARPRSGSAAAPVPGGAQGRGAAKPQKSPSGIRNVTFSRNIDSASTILLQKCIDSVSYDRVTLVKRRAVGGDATGEVFLRFDFVGVLVVNMDWSDDDEVEESCEFIWRSVTIRYRPQLPDGSLGAIVPAFWSMVPGEQPAPLTL